MPRKPSGAEVHRYFYPILDHHAALPWAPSLAARPGLPSFGPAHLTLTILPTRRHTPSHLVRCIAPSPRPRPTIFATTNYASLSAPQPTALSCPHGPRHAHVPPCLPPAFVFTLWARSPTLTRRLAGPHVKA